MTEGVTTWCLRVDLVAVAAAAVLLLPSGPGSNNNRSWRHFVNNTIKRQRSPYGAVMTASVALFLHKHCPCCEFCQMPSRSVLKRWDARNKQYLLLVWNNFIQVIISNTNACFQPWNPTKNWHRLFLLAFNTFIKEQLHLQRSSSIPLHCSEQFFILLSSK